MIKEREIISTYRKNNRVADIYKTTKGYEIELYEKGKKIRVVEAWDHSESWADDVAENVIQGVIRAWEGKRYRLWKIQKQITIVLFGVVL